MSELSCVTTVSCTQRSRVGSERPRVPLDLVPCTFVVVAIRIALTALGAASVCVLSTFGYFNDMIDPEPCGRSSGDQDGDSGRQCDPQPRFPLLRFLQNMPSPPRDPQNPRDGGRG